MSAIVWQEPPLVTYNNRDHNRGKGLAQLFVAELRRRPGQWALYPTSMKTRAISQYRKSFPGVEWTARRRADGRFNIYARWIGES